MNPAIVCDRSFRNTCCKYIPASPLLPEKEPHDVPGAFIVCKLMSVPPPENRDLRVLLMSLNTHTADWQIS